MKSNQNSFFALAFGAVAEVSLYDGEKNMWTDSPQILSERDFERLTYLTVMALTQENHVVKKSLKSARVLPSDRIPSTVVTMNSQVILQDLDTKRRRDVTLVYPFNENAVLGKVSVESDLGSRMLGLQVGQVFLAEDTDGKIRKFAIVAIPFQPEALGLPY